VVEAAARDFRAGPLSPAQRALCEFGEKLALRPQEMTADDVEAVRAHGWSDAAIHDAIQVVSYFSYINRVADGVGVDPEPEWTE
jgi:uncharacterized peroxidase-related enzyme